MFFVVLSVVGLVVYKFEAKHAARNHTTAMEEVQEWWKQELAKLQGLPTNETTILSSTNTSDSQKNQEEPNIVIPKTNLGAVHYNPGAGLHPYNPFDFQPPDTYGSVFVPPLLEYDNDDSSQNSNLGYLMQPNIVNDTLVFVTEGDLYIASMTAPTAMKLTTTVGNVRTPILNPVFPYYIAFTATYTGRREIYLMDLRRSKRTQPAMRLTYWDSSTGVGNVVGWKNDGMTLVFSATSREIGLPDTRLYTLTLAQEGATPSLTKRETSHLPLRALQIEPVPLSQAIDGVWDDDNKCVYFTRHSQSSKTVRYVGGTAESIWLYCEGQVMATEITRNKDYRGTSKSPKLARVNGQMFLLFLSDRIKNSVGEWIPSSMNLFALPLQDEATLYNTPQSNFIQLSEISCQYAGLSLMEYDIDSITNRIVMRIGADLYVMSGGELEARITNIHKDEDHEIQKLPIVVYSDFHEHQERLLHVKVPDDLTSIDTFETAFGTTATLLGIRGQIFVIPVIEDLEAVQKFAGAGMNLPDRRYRVAPGATTGGIVRVLVTKFLPVLQEKDKTARRLALVLATDPISETAEHAFYLMEVQSDNAPNFVDVQDLPDPFLGGHLDGGSVAQGGLGSVNGDSVTISPCGRRVAWTDTDGRICVMTIPLYQTGKCKYTVLPVENERGEPMIGDQADLEWSPGGQYLAITHSARNQFRIISIVELGDPEGDGPEDIVDIKLGRVVQATPDRFNSGDCYWGKTALDISLQSISPQILALLGDVDKLTEGSTALFFLSDRDIITDVDSPWGTRSPSPHFPSSSSMYALPLITESQRNNKLNPTKGTFGGGGASELWTDKILALDDIMEKVIAATTHLSDSSSRRLNWATFVARSEQLLNNQRYGREVSDVNRDLMEMSPQRRKLDGPQKSDGSSYSGGSSFTGGSSYLDSAGSGDTGLKGSSGSEPPSNAPFIPSSGPSPMPSGIENDPNQGQKSDAKTTPSSNPSTSEKQSGDYTSNEETNGVIGKDSNADQNDRNDREPSASPMENFEKDSKAFGTVQNEPSSLPFASPTSSPSISSTPKERSQSALPTTEATSSPSTAPIIRATSSPSAAPIIRATATPSAAPIIRATSSPSAAPIVIATSTPSAAPTVKPTALPSAAPSVKPTVSPSGSPSSTPSTASSVKSPFPKDAVIDFGPADLTFARNAYRIGGIPAGKYVSIVSQSTDGSFVLLQLDEDGKPKIVIFSAADFPSDKLELIPVDLPGKQCMGAFVSTTREHIQVVYSGIIKVVPNTAQGLAGLISDAKYTSNIVDTSEISLSVWPALEYGQIFNDAWRLLRDYFYDSGMNGVDWPAMHTRYKHLVKRCTKREELDDILGQMAAELSALHVFVYGGEFADPLHGDKTLTSIHAIASFGATLDRTPEYNGYVVSSIPERDPDFNLLDGSAMFSPLSDRSLTLSGQRGLQVGDVIVGINGESVMRVPDIHMLLRGQAGRSMRLDVLRLASYTNSSENLVPEPIITVPISGDESANLRYAAWEWKSREDAKAMAAARGFTTGYVHLRSMSGPEDADAFFRGFFSDYDKQALIVDVRHNRGGNIDSWLLDILQRRAWMYWHGRVTDIHSGGLGWDEQFAFRGHLVVLIDEHTSSDGEGFARGVSELKLGQLIGRRTWGGGIWLSSDNKLVDGGIATAPEIGTYNNNFGWGLGIEQMGVEPDKEVDNNPRTAYDGKDDQLEAAIIYLADWIAREPIVDPRSPGPKNDKSMPKEGLECKVKL